MQNVLCYTQTEITKEKSILRRRQLSNSLRPNLTVDTATYRQLSDD